MSGSKVVTSTITSDVGNLIISSQSSVDFDAKSVQNMGNLSLGNLTSVQTPGVISLDLGGTYTDDYFNASSQKLKIYNDGTNVYGFGYDGFSMYSQSNEYSIICGTKKVLSTNSSSILLNGENVYCNGNLNILGVYDVNMGRNNIKDISSLIFPTPSTQYNYNRIIQVNPIIGRTGKFSTSTTPAINLGNTYFDYLKPIEDQNAMKLILYDNTAGTSKIGISVTGDNDSPFSVNYISNDPSVTHNFYSGTTKSFWTNNLGASAINLTVTGGGISSPTITCESGLYGNISCTNNISCENNISNVSTSNSIVSMNINTGNINSTIGTFGNLSANRGNFGNSSIYTSGNSADIYSPDAISGNIDMSYDGRYMVINSSDLTVAVSQNYGKTWTRVLTGTIPTKVVSVSRDGKYMYVSLDGNLYRSSDYGTTWGMALSLSKTIGAKVSGSGRYVYVCGDNPESDLYVSNDYGETFSPLGLFKYTQFIDCSYDGKVIHFIDSFGVNHTPYVSYNYGETFIPGGMTIGFTKSIKCSADGSKVYIAATSGGYYNHNWGSPGYWTPTPESLELSCCDVNFDGSIIIVGYFLSEQGIFAISYDGGITFEPFITLPYFPLDCSLTYDGKGYFITVSGPYVKIHIPSSTEFILNGDENSPLYLDSKVVFRDKIVVENDLTAKVSTLYAGYPPKLQSPQHSRTGGAYVFTPASSCVFTSDASPLLYSTFTAPMNSAISITFDVLGKRSDSLECARGIIKSTYLRNGNTVVAIGYSAIWSKSNNATIVDSNISINGVNLDVFVQGITGETWIWTGSLTCSTI